MKIDIRNVHFHVDEKVRDYAVEKIGRLEKYYKNIIKASIVFEEHAGDTANVRYCFKVVLAIPGGDIRVEECGKNIFAVIDKAEHVLRERIQKVKGKRNPSRIHRVKSWVKDFIGKKDDNLK